MILESSSELTGVQNLGLSHNKGKIFHYKDLLKKKISVFDTNTAWENVQTHNSL